jgi:ubiquinone/menaquinone biosynthesis C-methylase UbiE
MADFSTISSAYKKKSLLQASAGEQLIDTLSIPPTADILDIGCGAGNLTEQLRDLTSGRVVGVDPTEGMIQQAQRDYGRKDIEFLVLSDSQLTFSDEFDVIFAIRRFSGFQTHVAH